jgi:type VI secretion system protein ImpL
MAGSNSKRWIAALVALVVFIVLAWVLGVYVPLTDGERLWLRVGLVTLGVITAGALAWFLRPQGPPAPSKQKDDALVSVATARARMPRGAFDAKPLVLLVGTEGSCKTTVVQRAELDPELLGGEALGGDGPPAPTASANLWLVKDAVLAEAGGPVFSDAGRWKEFVRALRAPRLRAALGRGSAPPRSAVVCVSCDVFYSGAGEQLDTIAALTRQRLADAARDLGVALPVYVLFTKADRIPHFEAWASPFTRDEVRQPLGAAVPLMDDGAEAAGSYAERLVPRIEAAFGEIVGSMAGRRLDLLAREGAPERRLAAYEVPRELGKLAPLATRFLTEICRPLQLGVSPKLRGFYFVGARPVLVTDATAAPAPAAAAAAVAGGSRATVAFARPNLSVGGAPGAYGPPSTAARKVPQWTFLDRIFPDIIFGDPVPPVLAGGGTRVAGLRRALLGSGIAAGLVLAGAVLVSWLSNRSLANRTIAAARAVEALPVVQAPEGTILFPSAEALRRLDDLRAVLDEVRTAEVDGVPLHMRWGLWRGNQLLADGRRVWVTGYRRQLHDVAYAALVDSLRALPAAPRPTDDYGTDYAWLKAYLEMTSDANRATPDFLAPVLLKSWQRGQPTDADITALARRQFEFFAGELPRANPIPQPADAQLVRNTRGFLGGFQGPQRIYQYMLSEAGKAAKPAKLVEHSPTSVGVVSAPEVAGSFTADGWKFMQDAFRNADRFFEGEQWVVGDAGAAGQQDRDRIVAELRRQYRADYTQQWRTYLRSIAVNRLTSVADAATKLTTLGGAQSPLLAALSLAAQNTGARATDSALAAGFQPVHAVTAPDVIDKLVTDANKSYSDGLIALGTTVDAVAKAPPVTDSASALAKQAANQQALDEARKAKTSTLQVAAKFNTDTAAAQTGPTVSALLTAPIDMAEALLRGARYVYTAPVKPKPGDKPAAAPPPPPPANPAEKAALIKAINDRGAAFCAQLSPLLAKFPFSPDATAEASAKEVADALAPGSGALWLFEKDRLDDLLEKQGDKWAPKADAPVALSEQFVQFFNRAARASAGLFPAGAAEPKMVVRAHAVSTDKAPEIYLRQGSQEARFVKNSPPQQFVWPSTTGREASLSSKLVRAHRSDTRVTVARGVGDWALFRLVAQATKSEGTHAEWNNKDVGTIAIDFEYENGLPVLARGWLGMSCTGQVTK